MSHDLKHICQHTASVDRTRTTPDSTRSTGGSRLGNGLPLKLTRRTNKNPQTNQLSGITVESLGLLSTHQPPLRLHPSESSILIIIPLISADAQWPFFPLSARLPFHSRSHTVPQQQTRGLLPMLGGTRKLESKHGIKIFFVSLSLAP